MSLLPPCYGIIPARFASTRFPGKPLADILGKPMFWHVYERARMCPEMHRVVVATDDERILSAASSLGVPAVMTRDDHPSGTDRVLEAAHILQVPGEAIVVNIQGDEPALEPGMLSDLVGPFAGSGVRVTTLARPIDAVEAGNPDRVKVVFDSQDRALYFSRAAIPFPRDRQPPAYFGHIGLYAFRMAALETFVSLGPGRLERIEKLEQLRLLEHGIPIHVVRTAHRSIGVDHPDDLQAVIGILSERHT